jgi:YVTN family beta-propeller protein
MRTRIVSSTCRRGWWALPLTALLLAGACDRPQPTAPETVEPLAPAQNLVAQVAFEVDPVSGSVTILDTDPGRSGGDALALVPVTPDHVLASAICQGCGDGDLHNQTIIVTFTPKRFILEGVDFRRTPGGDHLAPMTCVNCRVLHALLRGADGRTPPPGELGPGEAFEAVLRVDALQPQPFIVRFDLVADVIRSAPPVGPLRVYMNVRRSFTEHDAVVIDPATNQVIARIGGLAVVGDGPDVTATPSGRFVYVSGGYARTVNVISTATNSLVATIRGFPGTTHSMEVTPDGRSLWVAQWADHWMSVVDVATNTIRRSFRIAGAPVGVDFTPDGAYAYVALSHAGTVAVFSTTTLQRVASIPVGAGPSNIEFTPDGRFAYVSNEYSNSVSVINTATRRVVATVPLSHNPGAVVISPDGRFAYVSSPRGNAVWVISTATNTVVATIALDGASGLDITPDGAFLYVSNMAGYYSGIRGNSAHVVSTATRSKVADIDVGGWSNDVVVTHAPAW